MAIAVYHKLSDGHSPNGTIADILAEQPKSKIKVGDAKDVRGDYPFYTSGLSILEYSEFLADGRNILLNTGGSAGVKFHIGKVAYSTDTWCVYGKNDYTDYLYLTLLEMKDELELIYFEGATLKHLQKPKLKSREIYIPSAEELSAFNSEIMPMFDLISSNVRENKKLSQVRDALLPKLMSGELDVSTIDI